MQSENEMCHDFLKIFDNLKRSYFSSPKEDMNCQPIRWKDVFKQGNYILDFRMEIGDTVESDKFCF